MMASNPAPDDEGVLCALAQDMACNEAGDGGPSPVKRVVVGEAGGDSGAMTFGFNGQGKLGCSLAPDLLYLLNCELCHHSTPCPLPPPGRPLAPRAVPWKCVMLEGMRRWGSFFDHGFREGTPI